MEVPKKFELNLDDYKVYFDNNKKTHVCENKQTGEKTNIGFFGILLQMGIIKTIDGSKDDMMKTILDRLGSLESKLEDLTNRIDGVSSVPEENVSEETENIPEEIEQQTPNIQDRIIKNVLEKSDEREQVEEIETQNEPPQPKEPESDVVVESNEEIDNWSAI